MKSFSGVQLFATPWTIAYQAPPTMEFSRPEYWSGLPFPSPEDLPDTEIEPGSPKLQADALPSEPPEKPTRWGRWYHKGQMVPQRNIFPQMSVGPVWRTLALMEGWRKTQSSYVGNSHFLLLRREQKGEQ